MNVKMHLAAVVVIGLTFPLAAHAIDPAYAKKLERSGCTQASELQGCNINKTKAENAKAGFGAAPVAAASALAGTWIARNAETNQVVSTIRVDKNNKVTVNGKPVAAKFVDGALQFKVGFITYTVRGDRRLPNEDSWFDADAQSTGPIRRQ